MKKIMLALVLSVMLISLVQASELVTFNGNFQNGTTLHSNVKHLTNQSFYGKDVYKDRSTIYSNVVCTNETINYMEPVCVSNTTYYTRLVRVRHGHNITYENRTYSRTRRECHSESRTKIVESCRTVRTKIGCLNPNGVYTNQLNLMNFEYSFDGSNWFKVPYPRNEIFVSDADVQFRVIIPAVCSPVYFINSAIYIN